MHDPTRRTLLALAGTVGLGLAGCLESNRSASPASGDLESADGTGGDDAENDEPPDDRETADEKSDEDDPEDEHGEGTNDEPPNWTTTELEDVTTGETFTLDEFDVPVLLETFAVWCPDCLEQQRESQAFHEGSDLDAVSVALNVDPNEDADVVRDHAEAHGFDWYFAVAPPEVTADLVDEYGESIAHPPASPVVLRCPDGSSRRLEDGLQPAEALEEAVEEGC